jgi:hypothetical protein
VISLFNRIVLGTVVIGSLLMALYFYAKKEGLTCNLLRQLLHPQQ